MHPARTAAAPNNDDATTRAALIAYASEAWPSLNAATRSAFINAFCSRCAALEREPTLELARQWFGSLMGDGALLPDEN